MLSTQPHTQDPSRLAPLPEDDTQLILRSEINRYLPLAPQTMARWAVEGSGPPYLKLGRCAAYRTGDLREWMNSQVRQNTAT